MKNLKLILYSIFAIAGLVLIAPAAAQWQALQIQAGLGNPAPFNAAVLKMAGGIACMAIVWYGLRATRND